MATGLCCDTHSKKARSREYPASEPVQVVEARIPVRLGHKSGGAHALRQRGNHEAVWIMMSTNDVWTGCPGKGLNTNGDE